MAMPTIIILIKIPNQDENYILVAPHRTWWDPVYMAFATKPKQFIFMAKKELFTNRIFGWWIRMCGAFPIDRENPSASAIKYPINVLKKATALSSCSKWKPSLKRCQGWSCPDCQNGQGPYHAGYLYRSHDFEGLD